MHPRPMEVVRRREGGFENYNKALLVKEVLYSFFDPSCLSVSDYQRISFQTNSVQHQSHHLPHRGGSDGSAFDHFVVYH